MSNPEPMRRDYVLYSAPNDTVFAFVEAPNPDRALDGFAKQYGFPDFDSMRDAGVFSTLVAHRVH